MRFAAAIQVVSKLLIEPSNPAQNRLTKTVPCIGIMLRFYYITLCRINKEKICLNS